jgi:hypothetical protein
VNRQEAVKLRQNRLIAGIVRDDRGLAPPECPVSALASVSPAPRQLRDVRHHKRVVLWF